MLNSELELPRVSEEYKSIEDLTLLRIRRAIVGGQLRPGERIRQDELANQLGVSRMPIRVALRRLSDEGLVTSDRGVAMVTKLSIDEAEEIYAMRLGLESLAARIGAINMTPKPLELMRNLIRALQSDVDAQDTGEFLRHDRAFHQAHYEMAGRPSLVNTIRDIWQRGDRYMRISATLGKTMPSAMVAHYQLLEACEKFDGHLAQETTRNYLDHAARAVIESLREKGVDQMP